MRDNSKWLILIALAVVWGSSFILMKYALKSINPVQVGALRMIISAMFLFAFVGNRVKMIEKRHWRYLFYNAIVGTFVPVFLFTYAVQHIDSGIVAILNSLTPLNTLMLGFLFFGFLFQRKQILGIFLGLAATIFLISRSAELNPQDDYTYAWLVILATFGYAANVNILKKYLSDLDSIAIAVGNFIIVIIPALIVLYFSDFFTLDFYNPQVWHALGYISILAIVGTAIATIFFNNLIKVSSPIFASSVTYLIPIVALLWGILDGEHIHLSQVVAGLVILLAVYLVNRR
jgi:drug/metabolite transporter (DMT)-like permease